MIVKSLKISFFLLIIIILGAILFLFNSTYDWTGEKPHFCKGIEYRRPTWLSNKRILFIKKVDYKRSNFYGVSPLTHFLNGFGAPEYRPIRTDYYICSMKTDGTDERIIKQFASICVYNKNKKYIYDYDVKEVMVENGKEIPLDEAIHPFAIDCSPKADLIALEATGIYTMNLDGSHLEKISNKGMEPRFSPNGTKIVYRTKDDLYIMNSDGSDKYRLVDGIVCGIWHPNGKRIFFYCHGRKDYNIYMINSDGTGKKKFIETGLSPVDWSPDGSRFIIGLSMYTSEGKEIWNPFLASRFKNPKKYSIPYNGRFSPDGTKIVGKPGQDWPKGLGDIAILSSDFATIKVLGRNKRIDIYKKWGKKYEKQHIY